MREREKDEETETEENNRVSWEQGRDATAERRIKVSDNVIYEIDLNPAFKQRAIIQSRSLFPSFSISAILSFPPFHSRLWPPPLVRPCTIPQGHVRYSIYT